MSETLQAESTAQETTNKKPHWKTLQKLQQQQEQAEQPKDLESNEQQNETDSEQAESLSNSDETLIQKAEKVDQSKVTKPKKTEETLDDKIQAIYEMLPMIRETNNICQFMLENRGFNKAYQWYMDKDSESRKSATLYAVLDYYGIHHHHQHNVNELTKVVYRKEEHIDTICKYLALEWIAYNRDDFRFKPLPHEEPENTWRPWSYRK